MKTVPAFSVMTPPNFDVNEYAGMSAEALVGEINCENV